MPQHFVGMEVRSRSGEYFLAQGTEHVTAGEADATFPCIRRSTSFPRCGYQGRHPIRPTLNVDESVIGRNWCRGRWLLDSVREGSRHAAQSYHAGMIALDALEDASSQLSSIDALNVHSPIDIRSDTST